MLNLIFLFIQICFLNLPLGWATPELSDIGKKEDSPAFASVLTETPFWKRPDLYRKVKEEKYIAVSSRFDENYKGWIFTGGGQVHASIDKTWEAVLDFKRLQKLTDIFKSVVYDKSQKKLMLSIKILAIEKDLVLRFKQEDTRKDLKKLSFQIEKGFMQELEGVLVLEGTMATTDVGIKAVYPREVETWPKWIFTVATEALMSRIASELRSMVEKGE